MAHTGLLALRLAGLLVWMRSSGGRASWPLPPCASCAKDVCFEPAYFPQWFAPLSAMAELLEEELDFLECPGSSIPRCRNCFLQLGSVEHAQVQQDTSEGAPAASDGDRVAPQAEGVHLEQSAAKGDRVAPQAEGVHLEQSAAKGDAPSMAGSPSPGNVSTGMLDTATSQETAGNASTAALGPATVRATAGSASLLPETGFQYWFSSHLPLMVLQHAREFAAEHMSSGSLTGGLLGGASLLIALLVVGCAFFMLWPSGYHKQAEADQPMLRPAQLGPAWQPSSRPQTRHLDSPAPEPQQILPGPAARRRQRAAAASLHGRCPRLCQGLVVPPGSDCVLAVRVATPGPEPCTVDISDLRGKPVLKAHITRPHSWSQVDENIVTTMPWNFSYTPAISLCMLENAPEEGSAPRLSSSTMPTTSPRRSTTVARHGSEGTVLALCHDGVVSTFRTHVFVYDSDGRCFGSVCKEPNQARYVFTEFKTRHTLYFDGLFADHAVCISGGDQQRLGETEPCRMAFDLTHEFYRLRCSGAVDVGLVICCLLAIGEMEAHGPRPGDSR